QMETVLEHFDAIVTHYGARAGVKIARKHLGWYSKGLPNSAEFRQEVFQLEDPAAVQARIRAFYEPQLERLAA
ncbi:MAG: tRNA-dihydrouridine synthase, partial [Rhodospirillaceae bacterium]